MARGRATVDWNHIVRPAQGNTNTHQVPSQEGLGVTVAVYILEHIKYREEGCALGRVGEECFCQAEKTRLGTWRLPQSREVSTSEF